MFEDLKEIMPKELKEITRIMSYQRISIKREIIKRNQIENLELKSTISEIKILLQELNSKLLQTKERISNPKDRSVEITQSEKQKEKERMKENERI